MPRNCDFSSEVVKIVEAYRHAANYVVIFLNRAESTNSQFNEVVKRYNSEQLKLNEAIRTIAVTKNLSDTCYDSLMLIRRAVATTGEGLVAATMITYNRKCNLTKLEHTATTFSDRPISFDSNYLN